MSSRFIVTTSNTCMHPTHVHDRPIRPMSPDSRCSQPERPASNIRKQCTCQIRTTASNHVIPSLSTKTSSSLTSSGTSDVRRQNETSQYLRYVTRANPCADTRGDRIPSRARSSNGPMQIACDDTNARGCARSIPDPLPACFPAPWFERQHIAFVRRGPEPPRAGDGEFATPCPSFSGGGPRHWVRRSGRVRRKQEALLGPQRHGLPVWCSDRWPVRGSGCRGDGRARLPCPRGRRGWRSGTSGRCVDVGVLCCDPLGIKSCSFEQLHDVAGPRKRIIRTRRLLVSKGNDERQSWIGPLVVRVRRRGGTDPQPFTAHRRKTAHAGWVRVRGRIGGVGGRSRLAGKGTERNCSPIPTGTTKPRLVRTSKDGQRRRAPEQSTSIKGLGSLCKSEV